VDRIAPIFLVALAEHDEAHVGRRRAIAPAHDRAVTEAVAVAVLDDQKRIVLGSRRHLAQGDAQLAGATGATGASCAARSFIGMAGESVPSGRRAPSLRSVRSSKSLIGTAAPGARPSRCRRPRCGRPPPSPEAIDTPPGPWAGATPAAARAASRNSRILRMSRPIPTTRRHHIGRPRNPPTRRLCPQIIFARSLRRPSGSPPADLRHRPRPHSIAELLS
jgi:hypothetical protein